MSERRNIEHVLWEVSGRGRGPSWLWGWSYGHLDKSGFLPGLELAHFQVSLDEVKLEPVGGRTTGQAVWGMCTERTPVHSRDPGWCQNSSSPHFLLLGRSTRHGWGSVRLAGQRTKIRFGLCPQELYNLIGEGRPTVNQGPICQHMPCADMGNGKDGGGGRLAGLRLHDHASVPMNLIWSGTSSSECLARQLPDWLEERHPPMGQKLPHMLSSLLPSFLRCQGSQQASQRWDAKMVYWLRPMAARGGTSHLKVTSSQLWTAGCGCKSGLSF